MTNISYVVMGDNCHVLYKSSSLSPPIVGDCIVIGYDTYVVYKRIWVNGDLQLLVKRER